MKKKGWDPDSVQKKFMSLLKAPHFTLGNSRKKVCVTRGEDPLFT